MDLWIPTCKIVKVIGPSNDELTIKPTCKYGLSQSFQVEDEAKFMAQSSSKDCKGRKDFRKLLPSQAVGPETSMMPSLLRHQRLKLEFEAYLWFSYVKRGSALDNEAKKRANSTYLVGEVFPMLPHSLSSGICSLVEGEDRLVKSVIFRFSTNLELIGHHLYESVICSDKRLTYEQAILFLQKNNLEEVLQASPPQSRYRILDDTQSNNVPQEIDHSIKTR